MDAPYLETKRLLIKPLSSLDAELLFTYRSDPEIARYQSWKPTSLTEAAEFIRKNTERFNQTGTWFQLGIYPKENSRLIGDLGLHFCDDLQVEIGYTIAGPFQHNGYAKEAVGGVVNYLFGQLKKHRITASVDPENIASLTLLERFAFRKEAHFVQSIFSDGQWRDDLIYAVLAAEWGIKSSP